MNVWIKFALWWFVTNSLWSASLSFQTPRTSLHLHLSSFSSNRTPPPRLRFPAPYLLAEKTPSNNNENKNELPAVGSDDLVQKDVASSQRRTSSKRSFPSKLPSVGQMALFCASTALISISEPILSLVDTTVVSLSSTSLTQLAALGPATLLMDNLLYATSSLGTVTLNQVGRTLAKTNIPKLQRQTSQLLGVALMTGLVLQGLVYGLGTPILNLLLANADGKAELVSHAFSYCAIRATVAPLTILGMVSQAFLFANLDTRTPVLAMLVAFFFNVGGDVALRAWGIQGVAWATAMSSAVSALILVAKVYQTRTRFQQDYQDLQTGVEARMATQPAISKIVNGTPMLWSPDNATSTTVNTTRTNHPATTPIPFVSLPNRKDLWKLIQLTGPIFLVLLGKIVCYSSMTLRTSQLGVLALATHNIAMRLFFFFGCFGDSLSQSSQSFLPPLLLDKNKTATRPVLRKLLQSILVLSLGVGLFNCGWAFFLSHNAGHYLAKDAGVVLALRQQVSSYMGWALLLHPIIMAVEGTLIVTRDFKYLTASYAGSMVVLMGLLRASSQLQSVWRTLFLFQVLRLFQFGMRAWRTVWQRRSSQTQEASAVVAAAAS